MRNNESIRNARSLSRREFTKKSAVAIMAVSAAGLVGYTFFNTEKLITIKNIRRMGHCAPGIMQTLLDINGIHNENIVLYAGGMAGGIAGSDMECGALTAPLMFLGFQNASIAGTTKKIDVICRAQSYLNKFNECIGSTICGLIRQKSNSACIRTIRTFYNPFSEAVLYPVILSGETMKSYSLLLKTFDDNKFHCSQNVLGNLNGNFSVTNELLDTSWPFIGGIALLNRTCGALTGGVLAISSKTAKIENSYLRVARLNRLIRHENNAAMDEEINNFNRSINYSEELGHWFRNEFGSTSCHDIWGLNFSDMNDVEKYISGHCMLQCSYITKKVAQKVNSMI